MSGEASAELEDTVGMLCSPVVGGHPVAPWVKMTALHDTFTRVYHLLPAAEHVGLNVIHAVSVHGRIMSYLIHKDGYLGTTTNVTSPYVRSRHKSHTAATS